MLSRILIAAAVPTLLAACAGAPLVVGNCKVEANTSCANANLAGQNLSLRVLSGANFRNANLAGANLDQTDLRGADLSGANLQGASLVGTQLQGAKLDGADLSRATWLERRDGYGTAITRSCGAGSIGGCK